MQQVIPTGKGQIAETKSAIKRGIEADSFAGLKDGCKNLVLITHWKIKPKQEVMMHTNDQQLSSLVTGGVLGSWPIVSWLILFSLPEIFVLIQRYSKLSNMIN